jgi:hypothetical protein
MASPDYRWNCGYSLYSTLCGNYAWYVSSYTEQLFGTGNNQLKNVELRKLSEMAASSSFNNDGTRHI